MCGINGIVKKNTSEIQIEEQLKIMNQCIVHRGPDDEGIFTKQFSSHSFGFGMRRLSIIDLQSGHQPIYSADRLKVIVFNGEIYNYKILKRELQNQGVTFQTTSDTEVILKLYETYGTDSFAKLDGMFVFSIYDETLNKIFIARDYFGEKPLYYQHNNSGLIFSSELKSLKAVQNESFTIDKKGLSLYFQLTYIPAPFTIYEGVSKLEANHFLEYNITENSLDIKKSKLEKKAEKIDIPFAEAKGKIRQLVIDSVASRSISDVPLGTFLSGGVDSSIVSWCLAQNSADKIDTFSIGFDKKSFDETRKAQKVAQLIGSNHHEFIISEADLSADLDKILLNFDEPFADSSALPTFLVAQKTSEYVKVALTGDGGDEVFGGYNKYLIGNINKKYTRLVPEYLHRTVLNLTNTFTRQKEDYRGFKFKIRKSLHSINYSDDFFYNIIKLGFSNNDMNSYFLPEQTVSDPLSYYRTQVPSPITLTDFKEVDRMISLEGDINVKVDRTSMLSSLECRAPFLNKELWDYTQTLPEKYLIKGTDKKHILKKAFEEYFPDQFLNKSKKGFGVPVGDWLKVGIRIELESYIEIDFLKKQKIFNVESIRRLVKGHLSSMEDQSFKVWTFYCFQKWYSHQFL